MSAQTYKKINDFIDETKLDSSYKFRLKINFLKYKIEHNKNCKTNTTKDGKLKQDTLTENGKLETLIEETKQKFLEFLKTQPKNP